MYQNDSRRGLTNEENPGVYFARQTVQNACATQAIIGILLNHEELKLGDTLQSFKEFTSTLPYDMRGDMIGQQDLIREKHNSFARNDPFVSAEDKDDKDEKSGDAFHFVAYIPKHGCVYELDGMHDGPIKVGSYEENNGTTWMDVARDEIQRRISEFQSDEINFNLMAVTKNKGKFAVAERDALEAKIKEMKETGSEATEEKARLQALNQVIAEEEEKAQKHTKENNRRRHNYIPFIINVLKNMAAKGVLMPSYEKGSEVVKARKEELAKQKAEAAEKAVSKQ